MSPMMLTIAFIAVSFAVAFSLSVVTTSHTGP
jgi:hypothetical protein